MTWFLMVTGALCIIGGLLSIIGIGAVGVLIFIGGGLLAGLSVMIDLLQDIKGLLLKRLKDDKPAEGD